MTAAEHFVYVMSWPDGLVKPGYTGRGRWRYWMNRGGHLCRLFQFPDCVTALQGESMVRDAVRRFAFAPLTREAAEVRWRRPSGYLEAAYVESVDDVLAAIDVAMLGALLPSIATEQCTCMEHGRTDGRTDVEPWSTTGTTSAKRRARAKRIIEGEK